MEHMRQIRTEAAQLWLLDLDRVDGAQLRLWESWLSPEQRRRAAEQNGLHRRQSVAGAALARQLLARQSGMIPESLHFGVLENGKPICRESAMYFNVSHSGHFVVCALSQRPVGVDLEQVCPLRPALLRILSEEERVWVRGDETRFFRLWTVKEAVLKCQGGHVGQLRHLSLRLVGEEIARRQGPLRLDFPEPPDGFALSVCTQTEK